MNTFCFIQGVAEQHSVFVYSGFNTFCPEELDVELPVVPNESRALLCKYPSAKVNKLLWHHVHVMRIPAEAHSKDTIPKVVKATMASCLDIGCDINLFPYSVGEPSDAIGIPCDVKFWEDISFSF